MAKRDKPKLNYSDELRNLKDRGPGRLYLLYGEEDFLRERFFDEIKKLCGADDAGFDRKRLNGPSIDFSELNEAMNAMPFLAERTLIEIRDADINKIRDEDAERLKALLSDIPDYCTVVFILSPGYELDGRLAFPKLIKKIGSCLEFSAQEQNVLTIWIVRHFEALGKTISRGDAEYLSFVSGSLMNRLLPEIEKVASHAKGGAVTKQDIDATAHRIPEANAFEMVELLGQGKYDGAMALMSDLLSDKENHPIKILALIGFQMRRIFAMKAAMEAKSDRNTTMELTGVKFDFLLTKTRQCADSYSHARIEKILDMLAEYDYKMKSTGIDAAVLLKEFIVRMAAEK